MAEGTGNDDSERDVMVSTNVKEELALGLLYSYVAPIQHESDLETAKEKGVLPKGISWPKWRLFVHDFLDPNSRYQPIHHNMAVRFIYGELGLNRLDMIFFLTKPLTLGFMPLWTWYGDFVVNNSRWIIGGTAWIVVVLSAMQRASYGFAIFSKMGPIAVFALLFVCFFVTLVWNMVRRRNYERKRS
ncbi:hypothetical protein QBC45DRAFT_395174 [Copromyces sp. CBS 386.78]|nr:hypothetical protein QBC45DRAFT_395174 [Copromyces sp. CBS 386.78]